ncbi:MAG: YkgJ family cysteine cluster protein [Desulfobacterales bacterium]|jgi:uncharacterized protein
MEYTKITPCIECGACCAFYRVSFYWGESDLCAPNGVPSELLEKLNDFRFCMQGTQGSSPRCIALMGIIGKKVHCSIYERRASVCRQFDPSWQQGTPNEECDKARALWGLPPLTPEIGLPTKHRVGSIFTSGATIKAPAATLPNAAIFL